MSGGSHLHDRVEIEVVSERHDPEAEREEVRGGLTARPRRIPCRYFYDARGSRLFDEITRLPEYYLTRTETALLERHAGEIVERTGARELVELGSGTSTKTRILLDAMRAAGQLERYVPFDVSEPVVREAAAELAGRYPELEIHGVIGEFDRHLGDIPGGDRRLVSLLGSTIGNFDLAAATDLLRRIAEPMLPGEFFLLGVDLVKDADVLHAAYNDSAGVTARFNLNILDALNERFGGDFSTCLFDHRAFWDPRHERIEMWLDANRAHRVRLADLDLELAIDAGDGILTEYSHKYRREPVVEMLQAGGFELTDWLTDDDRLFALALARRAA